MISIIIPIYNAKKYLKKCIESILEQTFKDLELILVDDGSTDGSAQLCDEYAKRDDRIKVVHQENSGRVKARMVGLLNASSENIMFVDSDDWIDDDTCAVLLDIMQREKVDLVTSGYIFEKPFFSEAVIEPVPEMLYETEDIGFLVENALVYNGEDRFGILPSYCAKLLKKDITIDVMKDVPEDMYWGEDQLFVVLYLLKCSSVYVSHGAFYHYRMHAASTIHSPCPDFLWQMSMLNLALQKVLNSNEKQMNALHIRTLLNFVRLWNTQDKIAVRMPYYHFDYEKLGNGKIVLYGAGEVGKDYFWQLKKMSPNKLVLWVDKAYESIRNEEYDVLSIDEIRNVAFDKLLIAVEPEMLASRIREELTAHYNIPDEKIVWFKPGTLWV